MAIEKEEVDGKLLILRSVPHKDDAVKTTRKFIVRIPFGSGYLISNKVTCI
jgi:hypothetical protein